MYVFIFNRPKRNNFKNRINLNTSKLEELKTRTYNGIQSKYAPLFLNVIIANNNFPDELKDCILDHNMLEEILLESNFNFLMHAGPGIATMWNKDLQESNPMDPYFKNQDDIINLNFGFTPQFSLSSHWDINMDLSYTYNFEQNRAFDYTKGGNKTAMLYNLTLGVNYKFLKKSNFDANQY